MNEQKNLINKLKNIKSESEERLFLLDDKMNNLGNELNDMIDNYKINIIKEKGECDDNNILFHLEQNVFDYINNEREISINNLNNIFKNILENFNQKNINSNENENIKNILISIKKEFIKKNKEIINQTEELELQGKEIDNKIKTQMFEQFEKVNNRILKEIVTDNKVKDEIINYTQNYECSFTNEILIHGRSCAGWKIRV